MVSQILHSQLLSMTGIHPKRKIGDKVKMGVSSEILEQRKSKQVNKQRSSERAGPAGESGKLISHLFMLLVQPEQQ